MKRLFVFALAILMLFSACGPKESEAAPSAAEVSSAEVSIAANENFAFSVTGGETGSEGDYILTVRCENRSGSTLSFSWARTSVNDYMLDPDWSTEIPAGKKSIEKIAFDGGALRECGIADVQEIAFDLLVSGAEAALLSESSYVLILEDGVPAAVEYNTAETERKAESTPTPDPTPDPTPTPSPTPTAEPETRPFLASGPRDRIFAGGDKIVWLHADGTVSGAGYVEGHAQELKAWRGIQYVAVASSHTMGLREDNTIDQIGAENYLNTDDLSDVVHIAAGKDHSVIVHGNGSCTLLGYSSPLVISCFEELPFITSASVGSSHSAAMNAEGHWFVAGNANYGQEDLSYLLEPLKLICGGDHTVALDGRGWVEAVGANNFGQCETQGWYDIVDIAAGMLHTVGLRSDGSVIASGDNRYGQCNVNGWTDIVAIACGDYFTVGVRSDGQVLVAHNNGPAAAAKKIAETWVLPNPLHADELFY